MSNWAIDDVAARFAEAANTGRRLPPVRVQGYFTTWPAILRREWETLSAEEKSFSHQPPSPASIDRMLETMRWALWLEEEQRHLVWMRARQCEWKDICRRLGCDRTTAWRRWHKALLIVAVNLNSKADYPATCGVEQR